MRVIIDTSAFIAYANRRDRYHNQIAQIFDDMADSESSYSPIFTCFYVIDETITFLRYHHNHHTASIWGTRIFNSNLIEIILEDRELLINAWAFFNRYSDKNLSFTDCVIATIVNERNLDGVVSLDEDFRKLGLTVIP